MSKPKFDPDMWGTSADYKRAAKAVGVAAKALAKSAAGKDTAAEERRLDELIEEARRAGGPS